MPGVGDENAAVRAAIPSSLQRLGALGEGARLLAHVAGGDHAREDQLARRLGVGERRGEAQQRVERAGVTREDEQRPVGLRRRPPRALLELELGVLLEDRLLEPPQRLAGLEPELVGQLLTGGAVDVQRLGLAARAVERQHELAAQTLAQRVRRDQRLQLADQVGMPAAGQLGVDALLERRQPQLLEPQDLRLRERLVGEVGERRAPPQGQRLAQLRGGSSGLGPPRLGAQALEHRDVQLVRFDVQHVAGRARGQPLGAELAPVAHDVALDALGRGGRRRLAPQLADQPVGGDDLVRVQQQERQQRPLLHPAQ